MERSPRRGQGCAISGCIQITFKQGSEKKKPPSYYNTGTRIGQILQARLRLGCSSLNADLYRKNIVPSPTCACGGFESAYHFFFACPRLAHFRRRYFSDSLSNYTVKDFLYGSQNLTFQEMNSYFLKCKSI